MKRSAAIALVGSSVVALTTLLGAAPAAAAGSDKPRGATKFRSLPYTDTTDASAATGSSRDPSSNCPSDPPNASVWYRFQPKANGVFTIDTFGSDYDTVLAVYAGSPGQSAKKLREIVCNDDMGADEEDWSLQSQVQFRGKRNKTYFVMIDSYSDGPAGNLVLNAH